MISQSAAPGTDDGEIEHLGRADAEAKIRGHRVDLGEIENVLMEEPGVAEAVAALAPISDASEAPRELAACLVRSADADAEDSGDDGRKDGGDGDDDGDDDDGGDGTLTQRLYGQLQQRLPD